LGEKEKLNGLHGYNLQNPKFKFCENIKNLMQIIPGSQGLLGVKLSRLTGFSLGYVQLEKLPSGEKYIRVPQPPENAVIVNSLAYKPDEMIMESILIAETLREYGSKKVYGVFPYMPYSRKRFIKGEAFPAKTLISNFFSVFDKIYVVDYHLEDYINEISKKIEIYNISAMEKLAEVAESLDVKDPIVVSPDEEGVRWASRFSKKLNIDYFYLTKIRVDAENVVIASKPPDVKDRDIFIVDDMISAGSTVIQAVKVLKKAKCRKIYVFSTHVLAKTETLRKIYEVGVEEIYGTDTVPSPVSKVSVSELIAKALKS